MTLLFPKTTKKKSFSQTNSLLYGFPKSGKTQFGSKITFDGKEPLFIMTEDGEGIHEISKARVKDWSSFCKLVDLLESKAKEVKDQYCCLVIDLVSDLDVWAAEWVAKANQVTHISDLSFGKGFNLHKEEFRKQVTRLMAILPCLFIAHTSEKEVNIQGTPVKVQAPTLSGRALEFINGKVDTIMFIKPASGEREGSIVIQPSTLAMTGSRYPQLIGEHAYSGKDADLVFKKLEALFNKEETKKESKNV
jgi:hypothetical protein